MERKHKYLKNYVIPLIIVFLFLKVKAESYDSAFIALNNLNQKDSLFLDSNEEKYLKAYNFFKNKNYSKSLELSYDLLKIKDQKNLIKTNNLLGELFLKKLDINTALNYFRESLRMIDESKFSNKENNFPYSDLKTLEAQVLLSLSKIYVDEHQKNAKIDSSFYFLNRLVNIESLNEDISIVKAKGYNNLSIHEFQRKKYELAESYSLKAINILKKANKKKELTWAYISLANIYEVTYKREEALKTYFKAIPYIESNSDPSYLEYKEILYYNIAWTMYNLKDYKAYEYLEKSYDLKDSLLDVNLKKELKKIEQTHNVDLIRKEEETKRFRLEKTNWLIGGIMVVLSFLLLYFTNRYRSNQKELKLKLSLKEFEQQKRLDNLQLESQAKILNATLDGKEKERKQIAETLHDSVSALLSSANLHLEASEKYFDGKSPVELDKTKEIISEASEKIRDLSHNLISSVLLKFGLEYALKDAAVKYSNSTIKIYTAIADLNRYEQDFEIKIFNIIQELVNNILKHSKASTAYIAVDEEDEGLLIIVKDNGIGLKNKGEENKGIGLHQIQGRIQTMKGTFDIDSSKNTGTKITLKIPVVKRELTTFG